MRKSSGKARKTKKVSLNSLPILYFAKATPVWNNIDRTSGRNRILSWHPVVFKQHDAHTHTHTEKSLFFAVVLITECANQACVIKESGLFYPSLALKQVQSMFRCCFRHITHLALFYCELNLHDCAFLFRPHSTRGLTRTTCFWKKRTWTPKACTAARCPRRAPVSRPSKERGNYASTVSTALRFTKLQLEVVRNP